MLNDSTWIPSWTTPPRNEPLDREELAHHHGFQSFAELLAASGALPIANGESVQSYLLRRPDGQWVVWKDTFTAQTGG